MILGLLLLMMAFLVGCGGQQPAPQESGSGAAGKAAQQTETMPTGNVTIKMLNVGQGDSILVQTAEQTVLIDTSDVDEQDKLRAELKRANVQKIDKVILTHPPADNLGGMPVL